MLYMKTDLYMYVVLILLQAVVEIVDALAVSFAPAFGSLLYMVSVGLNKIVLIWYLHCGF